MQRIEYAYVDQEFSDVLTCPLCLEPFLEPKVTPCDHVFCSSCAESLFRDNPSCPICRAACQLEALSDGDRTLLKMLNQLKVRCPNHPQCLWLGERADVSHHVDKDCDREWIACPKCSSGVVRCLLDDHFFLECEEALRERSDAQTLERDALQAVVSTLQAENSRLEKQIEKKKAEKVQQRKAYEKNIEGYKQKERKLHGKLEEAAKQQTQQRKAYEKNIEGYKVNQMVLLEKLEELADQQIENYDRYKKDVEGYKAREMELMQKLKQAVRKQTEVREMYERNIVRYQMKEKELMQNRDLMAKKEAETRRWAQHLEAELQMRDSKCNQFGVEIRTLRAQLARFAVEKEAHSASWLVGLTWRKVLVSWVLLIIAFLLVLIIASAPLEKRKP